MNKQKVLPAWAGLFFVALVMMLIGCEIPTDDKFEFPISGSETSTGGLLPAPEIVVDGTTLKLTWSPSPEATGFDIYRRRILKEEDIAKKNDEGNPLWEDLKAGDWNVEQWEDAAVVGMVFTEEQQTPLHVEQASYELYDYFTEKNETYGYLVLEYYYNVRKDVMIKTSGWSKAVKGLVNDKFLAVEGEVQATYTQETGRVIFSPPLKLPEPHARAGISKILLGFGYASDDSLGYPYSNHLYDKAVPEINLRTLKFEDFFDKSVSFNIDYWPVYEARNSGSPNIHILLIPNYHVTQSGDDWKNISVREGNEGLEKPMMPQNLHITGVTESTISLAWEVTSGATEYRIYRSDNQDSGYEKVQTVSNTSYTDTERSPSTTYWYQISAYNSVEEGLKTKAISATTTAQGVTLPDAPQNLRETAIPTANTISIGWDAVAGATGYYVYQGENNDLIGTVQAPTTSYTNTGLTPNTPYSYTVAAYNSNGIGPKSVYITCRTKATGNSGDTLTAPTGVKATAQSDGYIKVEWNAVSGAKGYEVHFSERPNGNYYYYDAVSTDETWYIDEDVNPGDTWYYKVLAYNDAGSGPLSDYDSATALTPSSDVPSSFLGAPQKFHAEPRSDGIMLTWDAVPGAEGYTIYWSNEENGNYLASEFHFDVPATPNPYYLDTEIPEEEYGQTWYYKVLAYKNSGAVTSELSAVASVVVPTLK
ncbi:MAG: fibronectin type III domain-containing protein [Treponema sp.]|jgi:fibronectin type 3 domain-containing protein|nr:fibronectin type III domain-containing protein [Treponema sp.]